jgi:uncharacterized Rossmann fold enzyme
MEEVRISLFLTVKVNDLEEKKIRESTELFSGFTDGNGSRYGAKYFMDEDVVLITFQYR